MPSSDMQTLGKARRQRMALLTSPTSFRKSVVAWTGWPTGLYCTRWLRNLQHLSLALQPRSRGQLDMQMPTAPKLGDVVEQAWREVSSRSSDVDRKAISGLRSWLATQPNPHAAVLCGNPHIGRTDERSARELEALLLGRVASNKLSRTTAAQHLYLMHRIGKRLRKQRLPLNLLPKSKL